MPFTCSRIKTNKAWQKKKKKMKPIKSSSQDSTASNVCTLPLKEKMAASKGKTKEKRAASKEKLKRNEHCCLYF